jgi:hypothetical protein
MLFWTSWIQTTPLLFNIHFNIVPSTSKSSKLAYYNFVCIFVSPICVHVTLLYLTNVVMSTNYESIQTESLHEISNYKGQRCYIRMGEMRNSVIILVKSTNYLVWLGVNRRVLLKWLLKPMGDTQNREAFHVF